MLQYLYCNSQPHELTGIYPIGTTCANKGSATAVYSASYDTFGNMTSRTYNNVTATLSYDQFNRLVQWNTGSNRSGTSTMPVATVYSNARSAAARPA